MNIRDLLLLISVSVCNGMLFGAEYENLSARRHNHVVLSAEEVGRYEADAAEGDPLAMYNLGLYYQRGIFNEYHQPAPDYEQAVFWYRRAARAGSADAWVRLGLLYEKATPVPGIVFDTYREAETAYENAIRLDRRNANAHYLLAVLHEERFVPEWGSNQREQKKMNMERVVRLYKAAYQLGDARAQFRLITLMQKNSLWCCLCRMFCLSALDLRSLTPHGMFPR